MEKNTINWHAAFFDAIGLEFEDYADALLFEAEHPLTDEPLRIDALLIKKTTNTVIEKNIGRIFRKDNIIEYKSPEDYLSVKDFHKGLGYVHLYLASGGAAIEDITLSFVITRRPRKVFKLIREVFGWEIREEAQGIWVVSGAAAGIQIVESGKLPEEENLWLAGLRKGLSAERYGRVVQESEKRVKSGKTGAYMWAVNEANLELLEEVRKMHAKTLEEYIEEVGWAKTWEKRGREQGERLGEQRGREQGKQIGIIETARRAVRKNLPIEVIQEITGLSFEQINNLYKE